MSTSLEFPDDENGDVLRRMQSNGDNLSIARDIDFTVVFPNEFNAQSFSQYFQNLNYKVSVENSGCAPDLPWDVVVVKNMQPTHAAITSFEEALQSIASTFGGRNDGWGCVAQ